MSDYVIPEDCWPEILKRLPVKSLARFRCVCRQWNALICSSSFIVDHLACSKSKPRLFMENVYQKSSEDRSCVIFDSDSSSSATFIPHIMPTHPWSYKFVGSAKGILCFYVYPYPADYGEESDSGEEADCGEESDSGEEADCGEEAKIVLWNPLIDKYIKLPDEAHTHSTRVSVAIEAKPSEDNLRVLRVSYFESDDGIVQVVAVEIYSVGQGAWRVLHPKVPSFGRFHDFPVASCLNGDVYWVAVDDEGSYFLIHFGFEEEEFSRITLPGVLAVLAHNQDIFRLRVAVYFGRLALLQEYYGSRSEGSLLKIWTRVGNEEDSWRVIISFDPLNAYNCIHGITHDGQILMSRRCRYYDDDPVVLYNSTGKTCRRLDMHARGMVRDVCPFVESLAFMDGEGGAVSP